MPEYVQTVYPWKRFWCPWDKSISFADDGFVYDPESDYGSILNPELRSLDSLQELPCVILLGEPGLGKSQILREHRAALESAKDPARQVIYLDLKDFGSDAALTRGLFDSISFQHWKNSDALLYLLIDSFDEGLLTIESLSGYFSRELQVLSALPATLNTSTEALKSARMPPDRMKTEKVASSVTLQAPPPIARLFLRIACRPAVWPVSLTSDLRRIFTDQAVSIWRLAPLRKCDVECAAKTVAAAEFIQQVVRRGVVPFATKPITLKALLNLYKTNRALPHSKDALYQELCRVACTESSSSRRERHKVGRLTPNERFRVASRIAALMVFCNRTFLRTDLPLGDLEDEELAVDVVYGHERHSNGGVMINHDSLAETLDTTLFKWPKPHSVAWDHRTYSEYLAARYCYDSKLSAKDIVRLIFTAAFGEKRVAPQLYETTAWLCDLYPSLRSDVLSSDPMVLLLSDAMRDDTSIRYEVTERYLESFEKERVFDDQIRDELTLLEHPRLADQLRPYILGRTKKYHARSKAMDIAAACHVREVEIDLIRVALDSHETLRTRTHALFTVGKFPVSAARVMLRELITKPCPEDEAQELKGWTLMALWPSHVSTRELFSLLGDSGPRNFVGGYASLLHRVSQEIPSTLKEESDVLAALEWVEGQGIERDISNRLTTVADAVMLRAWDSLSSPTILDRFTRIVLKCIENHVPISRSDDIYRPGEKRRFYVLLTNDTTRRRLLIKSLVQYLAASGPAFPPFLLIFCDDGIVRTADTGWLIDLLPLCASAERQIVESLLERIPDDTHSLAAISKAVEEGRLPRTYSTRLYIELSSELALGLRKQYGEHTSAPRERKLLVPPPRERIVGYLRQVESGDTGIWSSVTRTLTLEEDSEYFGQEGDDLRKLPGWVSADEHLRKKIVLAAQTFLLEYKPTPAEYSQQTFGHWIIAAYLAFALVHDESMSFLEERGEEFWNRWSGLLLSYRFDNERGIDRKLLAFVRDRHPSGLVTGLAEVLCPALEDCYFLNKLANAWTPEVEQHLVDALKSGKLKSRCSDMVLMLLLNKANAEAEDFAISMARLGKDPEMQVRGAVALLRHSPTKSHDVVWPLIKASEDLGERILMSANDFGGRAAFLSSWSDTQLGELFVWMTRKFPYSEKLDTPDGAFVVGPAETVRDLRDSLLAYLRNRGTPEAVEALIDAGKALNVDWMKWHVAEAKNAGFRKEWEPAEPAYVLSLAQNAESLTPGQHAYYLVAVLAVVFNILANMLTPAILTNGTRTFLATGLFLLALILLEKANSKRSFWWPLCVILLVSDVVGYLLWKFLR